MDGGVVCLLCVGARNDGCWDSCERGRMGNEGERRMGMDTYVVDRG